MPRAAWLSRRQEPPSLTATQVALQFVNDLHSGGRPSIEAALDQAPAADWADLLRSLLIAEVNARRARGENPAARDYLPRFPAHTPIVRDVVPENPVPVPEPPRLPAPSVEYPEVAAVLVAAAPPTVTVAAPAPPVAIAPDPNQSPVILPPPMAQPRRRRRQLVGAVILLVAAGATAAPFLIHPHPKPGEHSPPPVSAATVSAPKKEPTAVPKAAPVDAERDLAEWVLEVGGHGTLLPDGASRRPFHAHTPLPKGRFAVTTIVLPRESAGRWKPENLDRLRGHNKLSGLEVHTAAELSEAALLPLAGLPLRTLELDAPVRAPGRFFASFGGLESLALPHAPDFVDADLVALGGLEKLSAQTVNSPRLTLKGFRELKCPALKSLTLGPDVALTPDHVRVLQRLPLEEFDCAAEVTDDTFVEFALFAEVRRIRLSNAPLSDSALRAVVGLGKLEEFRAVGASMTGPGLIHLAERKGLRVLDLSGAKLTDDGLGPLLGLPALRELRLAGNPITDDGAVILAQLDGIEILDLGETGVTDAALRALTKHLTLKTLIVTNTRVTPAAVRDFETLTPNCKVVFGKRK